MNDGRRLVRHGCQGAVILVLSLASVAFSRPVADPSSCALPETLISGKSRAVLDSVQILENRGDYVVAQDLLQRACANLPGSGRNRGDGLDESDSSLVDRIILTAWRSAFLIRLCRYGEADSALAPLLAQAQAQYGTESMELVPLLNAIGQVQFQVGHYVEADRTFRRALVLTRKFHGSDDAYAMAALQGLGRVLPKQRRLYVASDYAERSYQACLTDVHSTALDRASAAECLGMVRRRVGLYVEAERLFKEAVAVVDSAYGPDHPAAAMYHNRLAALYINIRRPEDAKREAQLGLDIATRRLGPDNLETGNALYHLALAELLQDTTKDIRESLDRVLAIETKCLGKSHYDVAGIYGYYGFYHRLRGEFAEAFQMAAKAAAIRRQDYIRNAGDMIDYDAMWYAIDYFYDVSDMVSYCLDAPGRDTSMIRQAAEGVLQTKGFAMTDLLVRRQCPAKTGDKEIKALVERLQRIRADKSLLFFRDPQRREEGAFARLDSLEWVEQDAISALADREADCRRAELEREPSIEQIRRQLPDGSTFVDYINYLWVRPSSTYAEERRLAALVIDKSGLKGFVQLDAHDFEKLITPFKVLMRGRTEAPSPVWNDSINILTRSLYDNVWAPLAHLVKDSLVFVSAAVGFDPIAFAALQTPEGEFLASKYEFHYVDNYRDFEPADHHKAFQRGGLFALGDPDFDAAPLMRKNASVGVPDLDTRKPKDYVVRNARAACLEFTDLQLAPLPGTRAEVARIADEWNRAPGHTSTVVTGAAASEEMVKWVAPGHRIIHLASHAYTLPDDCDRPSVVPIYYRGDNDPFTRFGLLLAGANLKGAGADAAGVEDGVLTAEEVTALPLEGTDLVVLSACESRAGLSINDEGLGLGLRRAFQMAGARTVISAAWPVADHVTLELMDRLYRDTVQTYAAILSQYARDKIHEARAQGRWPDPSEWASFVVSGDWHR